MREYAVRLSRGVVVAWIATDAEWKWGSLGPIHGWRLYVPQFEDATSQGSFLDGSLNISVTPGELNITPNDPGEYVAMVRNVPLAQISFAGQILLDKMYPRAKRLLRRLKVGQDIVGRKVMP